MASATTDRRQGLTGDKGFKAPVQAATTANIVLSGEQTVGGVAVKAIGINGYPDRVLVWNQTNPVENGIWNVSTASWTRSQDADGSQDLVTGTMGLVTGGTYINQLWMITTTGAISPGSTSLMFQLGIPTLPILALSTGSGLLGYLLSQAYPAGTVGARLNEQINLFSAGVFTTAEIADYRNRARTIDLTAKINVAISVAAALRAELVIPSGSTNIIPATVWAAEGGSTLGAFPMTSNMHLRFEPGAEFRIADNQSTDAGPKRLAMFYTNSVLSDVSFEFGDGSILDGNGANNKISPARPATYNQFDQSMIMVSGTPAGVAARIDRCVIRGRGRFINNAGSSCICMGQSNTAGTTLGTDWVVDGISFENNGLDTDDHTSVFAWANRVRVRNCDFTADTMQGTVGNTGGTAAFEFHGSDQEFHNNTVKNYYRGVWFASNYTAECKNQRAHDNEMVLVKAYGFDVFRESASASVISGAQCYNNLTIFDDSNGGLTPSLKVGFNLASSYSVLGFRVYNNRVKKTGNAIACAGVAIYPQSVAAQPYDQLDINSNTADGATYGVLVKTNATNGIGLLSIRNNVGIDLTTAAGTNPIGIAIDYSVTPSAITNLVLDGNTCTDGRLTPQCNYGIRVAGLVTNMFLGDNPSSGMTIADYTEGTLTVTTRKGRFQNVTYTPTWSAGGVPITLGNGASLARYTIQSGQVTITAALVVGSTTSFGAGALSMALPSASTVSGLRWIGPCRIFHAGVYTINLLAEVDGTSSTMVINVNGATNATAASPVALTTGDEIAIQLTYQ